MEAARARYWQERWRAAGLASGQRVPGRPKFYALIAYPGTSGFLHVGHLRSFAYLDALHRYHRMRGRSVLFPFGVHASGIPAVAWAQKVKDRDAATIHQLRSEGVPEQEWVRLEDPEAAARFLGETYRVVLRSLGVLVDEATYLTTVDDDYRAFVRWQFRALERAGALVKGTYFAPVCPVCGPVAVDPSETDLDSGGDAEVVRFTTVPFSLPDGRILLAATLRPETVYGVTNLWVAPGVPLVVWHQGDHQFLVTRPAAERLVEQHGGRVGHPVPPSELVGRTVRPPIGAAEVPILESALVDPAVGTGVVMSVPAHAPADAAALAELGPDLRSAVAPGPILLEIPADAALSPSDRELLQGSGSPADRALRAAGARGLSDRAAVDTATERLYRLEYVRGRMTVPELQGVLVRDAREQVAERLARTGTSFPLQEFSKPVVCRNGHAVVIRRVPDQWFLHYADPSWKSKVRARLDHLVTWPAEYREELSGIVDWFGDRPCTRRGRWLGTPLPFDPEWVIEPIADSTFYMAYYVVRRFVATGRLRTDQLTDAFFEYVFRGAGPGEPKVERAVLDEVRAEFLYWYPLDYNCGGKEHKRVHFPAFLFTHVALLDEPLQPHGIYVNGWITGTSGGKLSKKEVGAKGGRIPGIAVALEQSGADALRLMYTLASSPSQDVEWETSLLDAARERLADVERMVREARGAGAGEPELDAWLLSACHGLVGEVRAAYEGTDLRTAAELTYVRLPSLLRRYYTRGGQAGDATDRVARCWIRLLSPITPHLAEELHPAGGDLVATTAFPDPGEFARSERAERQETFLERVEEDLRAVLRPSLERAEAPYREVAFFVAAPWKATVESWIRDDLARGEEPTIRSILDRAAARPELAAFRPEMPKYVQRVLPLLRNEPRVVPAEVDELGCLRAVEAYLLRRYGFEQVTVHAESEAGPHDPKGRRERARPGRPAFYLIGPPGEPTGGRASSPGGRRGSGPAPTSGN